VGLWNNSNEDTAKPLEKLDLRAAVAIGNGAPLPIRRRDAKLGCPGNNRYSMIVKRFERAALPLFLAAILSGLCSCSTGAFSHGFCEFPVSASVENVPLRIDLPPENLRRRFALDVSSTKRFEELKNANAQVVVRIRNDGKQPFQTGVRNNDAPSVADLPPGWMATVFAGPVGELITTGRQSGPFFVTGENPHASMTLIFSNMASFKRDVSLVLRAAPSSNPL
jgi:hypothetical protein